MGPAIHIPPRWNIVEPGQATDGIPIVLEPGVGFGDGTHPTTRLCLQALSALAPRNPAAAWQMLDFGSGSGILAIGATRLGATVEAVEIDEQAIAHAYRNLAHNPAGDRVRFSKTLLNLPGPFDMVIANILCQVLIDYAEHLVDRLAPTGTLVLSGLVSTDVPQVSVRYRSLLDDRRPEIYQNEDWRALVWRSP